MEHAAISFASALEDHARLAYACALAHYPLSEQQQACHLIEADLRNYRLIHGLAKSGLEVNDFYTNLHPLIFSLLRFHPHEVTDKLFEFYIGRLESFMEIPVNEFLYQLPEISGNICQSLQNQRLR